MLDHASIEPLFQNPQPSYHPSLHANSDLIRFTPSSRTVQAAGLSAPFPEKSLRFLRIQAVRNITEVHHAKTVSRQKPAFAQNPDAGILIESQLASHDGYHPQLLFGLRPDSQPGLKLAESLTDRLHLSAHFQSGRAGRSPPLVSLRSGLFKRCQTGFDVFILNRLDRVAQDAVGSSNLGSRRRR